MLLRGTIITAILITAGGFIVDSPLKERLRSGEAQPAETELRLAVEAETFSRETVAREIVDRSEAFASDHCLDALCPFGFEDPTTTHAHFTVGMDTTAKTARWVAYSPSSELMGETVETDHVWADDPSLPADSMLEVRQGREGFDYFMAEQTLGYQRGHLAPHDLFAGSDSAKTLDYSSNIAPLTEDLSQGAWKDLAERERELAANREAGSLFSVAGTLHEGAMPPLPHADEAHSVPSHVWKIVTEGSGTRYAAFVMPQNADPAETACSYLADVPGIEARSGLAFGLERATADPSLVGCG